MAEPKEYKGYLKSYEPMIRTLADYGLPVNEIAREIYQHGARSRWSGPDEYRQLGTLNGMVRHILGLRSAPIRPQAQFYRELGA